jgi:hypothetical protein
MAVRPLRDGRYVVETEGGTYVVDLDASICTCPDSAIRESRCKHLRRVAIEITEGLVPSPGERTSVCAVCGRPVFVPMHARGPALCASHDHAPGDLVRDRETDSLVVVLRPTGERSDEATTAEGRVVADYETNAAYGGQEPVFEAVYVTSLPVDGSVAALADRKRYLFPASRLRPVERAFVDGDELVAATTGDANEPGIHPKETDSTQATLV